MKRADGENGLSLDASLIERAGVTATRVLLAGDWGPGGDERTRDSLMRMSMIDAADAVVWRNDDLRPCAVADAMRAALRQNLYFYGNGPVTSAFVHSDAGGFLGWPSSVESAVALASVCASHRFKGRLWMGFRELEEMLQRVESPAEARFAVALCGGSRLTLEPWWVVGNQTEVGRFRVDFSVVAANDPPEWVTPVKIAVEIDGHDWHERTKEQARRDKSRDRELQAEGWMVLRYTGSEVWADPIKCVRELEKIVSRHEAFGEEPSES
jgi:very-short-patch-repair endonuclease